MIEVLVALTIFLVSLAAIGALVDAGGARGQDAVLQTTATRLAQSIMAEVEAGAFGFSQSATESFPEEPDWTYSIEPGNQLAPNLYPVTVRVYRDIGSRRFEVSLHQVILDPAAMGNGAEAQPPASATSSTSSSGGTSP